ncbi:MAG TPA: NAD(P)-dependent oxidoreductase [Egibacteraceae bacterium]|nr:NAD(P)-dependent oxidoreductase [Egibacteraceae bacterium]
MKVFVAGATGVLGRRLLPRLVADGHDVTALARSDGGRRAVEAAGARPAQVSLFDLDALRTAIAGHEAVVNVATRIPTGPSAIRLAAWAENDRIRREGSANLVDAALHAGAGRYVQESIAFVYADHGAGWIAEDGRLDLEFQLYSAVDAEAQAARFTAAGGHGVALRFGLFLDETSAHYRDMTGMLRRGRIPAPGRADAYTATVMTDDAAAAMVAALRAPAGLYNVVEDEPSTRAAHYAAAAAALGLPAPKPLPAAVGELPRVRVLARSQRVSNRAFKEATGWAPRFSSARESWAELSRRAGAG